MERQAKKAEKARQKQERWLQQTHATPAERAARDLAIKRERDRHGMDHAMKKAAAITFQRKNSQHGPSVNMNAKLRKVKESELGFDADE